MPAILTVITNPNPQLRKTTEDLGIDEITGAKIQDFIRNLVYTMRKKDGVGLAAIQVGLNKSIIAINTKDNPLVLINPKIIKKSLLKQTMEEGCLSVPGVFGLVQRHKKIKVTALSVKGEKMELTMQGFLARIAQHEIDHLNGILFIDKAKKVYTYGDK